MESARVTWLDLVPHDVCKAIAAQLHDHSYSASLVNLSLTSSHQKSAVLAALNHAVDLFSITTDSLQQQWCTLLTPHAKQITLSNPICWSSYFTLLPSLAALFQSPRLRVLHIPDTIVFLRALSHLPALHQLRVYGMKTGSDDPFEIVQSLRHPTLQTLHLICCLSDHKRCPMHGSVPWNRIYSQFVHTCPNLTHFGRWCQQQSPQSPHRTETIWNMLSQFPKLRHVVLDCSPPSSTIPLLSKLDSVFLSDVPDCISLAQQIGSSVTGLSISYPVDLHRFFQLECLARITHLDILLTPSAEQTLQFVVQYMPLLTVLKVHATQQSRAVLPGVFLQIAQTATRLQHLELYTTRLNTGEVYEILMCLGKQLTHLGISVERQLKTPLEILDIILHTLYKHNPNLMCLHLAKTTPYFDRPVYAMQGEKRNLYVMLDRLHRRNPSIDLSHAYQLVDAAITQSHASASG